MEQNLRRVCPQQAVKSQPVSGASSYACSDWKSPVFTPEKKSTTAASQTRCRSVLSPRELAIDQE